MARRNSNAQRIWRPQLEDLDRLEIGTPFGDMPMQRRDYFIPVGIMGIIGALGLLASFPSIW